MPYDDMRTVSLTGRPWQEFDRALIEHAPKIGILTDREHTPVTIAARMLEYGYSHYTLYIGEHLGNPEKERIRRMTPREAVAGDSNIPIACCWTAIPDNAAQTPCTVAKPQTFQSVPSASPMKSLHILTDAPA